jgi:hypothetical protein
VKRLDGLLDEPRPGAPRTVTDATVERVVTLTFETMPRDATHWSTRAMARVYNEAPTPFVWTKTADAILASVARFYHRISDSGH